MEGDAGAAGQVSPEGGAGTGERGSGPRPSRLRRGGVVGVCAVLVALAAAAAAAGFSALRFHRESQAIARDDAAAVAAAEACIAATQAPDVSALAEAERQVMECTTDVFRMQAGMYTDVIMQAYQTAKVHVQVAEMRTAVERNNPDGSVDLLVAVRVRVDNVEAQGQEFGYRLRANMTREDDRYKIAKLEQVST